MRIQLSTPEILLAAACLALVLLAVFAPTLAQPQHTQVFADQRNLFGIAFAADVLSNLPFALLGALGQAACGRATRAQVPGAARVTATLFFAGLLVTACGSAWYHLHPSPASLVVDRLGMSVAFAGLLGVAAATRVSQRAGASLAIGVLALAPLAVLECLRTGNVLPWAALQFGGMALVVSMACLRAPAGALNIRWGGVIAAYAAAKWFEMNDHAVFELTHQMLSGHSVKHLVAALAALPVLAAVSRATSAATNSGQNAGNEEFA